MNCDEKPSLALPIYNTNANVSTWDLAIEQTREFRKPTHNLRLRFGFWLKGVPRHQFIQI